VLYRPTGLATARSLEGSCASWSGRLIHVGLQSAFRLRDFCEIEIGRFDSTFCCGKFDDKIITPLTIAQVEPEENFGDNLAYSQSIANLQLHH